VNANPSGSRTPPAGGRGASMARREGALAAGPSPSLVGFAWRAGSTGACDRQARGSIDGTRHAMTVCRGAPSARRAQGRVGDAFPRHIVGHLVAQPLLSASASVLADAVRPLFPGGASPWPSAESAVQEPSSQPEAQPKDRSSPRRGARDTELVQPGHVVFTTLCRGQSRGKGVLAV
jgi:hypothetical protein